MPELWGHALALVAAGVGAAARLLLDGAISEWIARRPGRRGALPWGTLAVNLSGALLIGLLAGATVGNLADFSSGTPRADLSAAALGFLGGFTTFSTASVQTVRLLRERRWALAAANGMGQWVATMGLVVLGWWLMASILG